MLKNATELIKNMLNWGKTLERDPHLFIEGGVHGSHVAAADADRTSVAFQNPDNDLLCCSLAGAGGTQKAEDLSPSNLEAEAPYHLLPLSGIGEA